MSVFMRMNIRVAYSIEFGVEPGKFIEQVMLDCIARYYERYEEEYCILKQGAVWADGPNARSAQQEDMCKQARFYALVCIDENPLLTDEEKEFLAKRVI